MTQTTQPVWEPIIFDDHGHPAFQTQEEEQQAWQDYVKLGPDHLATWYAVNEAVDQLAHYWGIDPANQISHATVLVRIAEQARQMAAEALSTITFDTPRPAHQVYQDVASRTGLDAHHLETTYPITPEPPF